MDNFYILWNKFQNYQLRFILAYEQEIFKCNGTGCHCRSVKEKSGKWPLELNDFFHNFLISNDCIQHSGKISICKPNKNIFLHSSMTFFVRF